MTAAEILRRDLDALSAALGLSRAEARLDARVLLAHALGVSRAWLIAHEQDELPPAALKTYDRLLARRLAGEPIAYILGEKEFFGRSFKVTPAVLIPRPETELLVEVALKKLPAGRARVLDLGTGSGCIAVTLALVRPDWTVVAIDQCQAALAVARDNAARLGAQVVFHQGDWFQALPPGEGEFDLVVGNPPYLAEGDAHLAALAQEPAAALTAGADGLAEIRRIVAGAGEWLAPGGWLLFEHGWDQGKACRRLLKQAGFVEVQTWIDLAGHERVASGRWPTAGRACNSSGCPHLVGNGSNRP